MASKTRERALKSTTTLSVQSPMNWRPHTAEDLIGQARRVALAQANFQVDPWTGFSLDCAVGMEENSEPELTIFPNPATDRVTIAAVGMDVAQAVLTDASGARVRSLDLSQGRTSFSVSSLNAGMYFLELKGKEGRVLRERIVLQGP